MGDVWPFGSPRYTNWDQCYTALRALGFDKGDANVLAAIAGAESSYDLSVVNDTPSTGDYSVGAWQINYYGSLYAGRVADYGTPRHLARSTVSDQAKAARGVWSGQGFGAWSTYNHGQYKAYLHGNLPQGPPAQHQLQAIDTGISPPTEDYSAVIRLGALHVGETATRLDHGTATIRSLLRRAYRG